MQTLSEAHERAVNGDRKLRITGVLNGYWYEDHVLDYVNRHRHAACVVSDENDEMVTVMLDGGRNGAER